MKNPEYLKWEIEYDNDAGYDGGFWEWWNVTNGERLFKVTSEKDAEWLCGILNSIKVSPEVPAQTRKPSCRPTI